MSNFSEVVKSNFRPATVAADGSKAVFKDGGAAELGTYGAILEHGASSGTVLKAAADSGLSIFMPFLRKSESRREVSGIAAQEERDKVGETMDYETSKPHFQEWVNGAIERTAAAGLPISYGNIRAQHSQTAAGKLVDVQFDDANKRVLVVAKIVDDAEWKKVLEGVYTGFSIGGKYVKKWGDGRYTVRPSEISIVDNPAMPSAQFTAIKSAPAEPTLLDQVRELAKQVDDMLARRNAHANQEETPTQRFRPLQHGESHAMKFEDVRSQEDKAASELRKALANGTPVFPIGQHPFEK